MADPIDFLSTLFASAPDDSIALIASSGAEALVKSADEINDFLAGSPDGVGTSALTGEGTIAFFHTFIDNMQPDEWQDMTLRPTVVLELDATTLLIYALEQGVSNEDFGTAFAAAGCVAEDVIPLPGAAPSWTIVAYDPEVYYVVDDILDAYGEASPAPVVIGGVETPPWEDEDFGTFVDARLLSPFDINDPLYQQEMQISVAPNQYSTDWKPETRIKTIADLISVLSRHPEGKTKEGHAFVLGKILGKHRRKTAVAACYGIGLDIDVGMPGVEVDAALRELGCLAVRYTTFSHKKTRSKLSKDKVLKWVKKNDLEKITTETLVRFLREESKWDQRVLDSAEYAGDSHEEDGLKVLVDHLPMEKHRIVLPLAEPFEPATVAETHAEGMAMWAKVCKAMARFMGDLPMDNSATDPSRLFYFPRHPKNGEYETTLHGGPLFDWRTLELDAAAPAPKSFEEAIIQEAAKPAVGKGKGKSQTDEGKNLGRWSMKSAHGFQIVDVIRDHDPDRIRTDGAMKIDIECPFDEDHSDPGNPEDRGCFAVNAGDGPSELFTVKCQHDSCQGKTNLDFLGKMIKDGWFDESVLEDPLYNAAAPEDAPNPEVAVKIAVEDDARAEYEKLIDALTEDSPDDMVDEAITAFLNADLSGRAIQRAEAAIKKNLKLTQAAFSRLLKEHRAKLAQSRNAKGDYKDPKGRVVFSYQGEFHFDEAYEMCFETLLRTNKADGEPTFSCVQEKPVKLSRNPKSGRITFEELTNRALWSELNKKITFVRRNDNTDGSRGAVPRDVAEHVYERAYDEFPQSPEIIYTPLFTQSGDLVVEPGYYEDLNILMANIGFEVDVPLKPSVEDVEDAVDFLTQELLVDFPFLDYDTAGEERRGPSLANAMAMIITPFMRRMIEGVTPVFFIAKPTPGTGGTLLGKLPMLIFDGQESAPMRYSQNEEEMQKALLAAIIETRSHLFFDDVKDFNNRVLLQSITSREIGGRMLGSTRNVTRPNLVGWIGTGNNPLIGNEMDRRICWVRLNAKTADIQKRTYHHSNLVGWISDNRSKIVGAILTMIQYWIDLGQPMFTTRGLASFENWAGKVGGVLEQCGIEGFLDNRRASIGDMDETANKAFIREWLRRYGFEKIKVGDLFQHATDLGLDIIEGNNDDQKKGRFPKRLHTLDGRVFVIENIDYIVKTSFDADDNTVYYLMPLAKDVEEAA